MREIHIGLLGLGTVGSGVLEIIRRREKQWIERYGFRPVIKKILVQNPEKKRNIPIDPELLTTDWLAIVNDPAIEVIIEVIGGEEPALSAAQSALAQGKYLVTANKLMLALHGPGLFSLARSKDVEIGFEASVGGGIPIIQPIRESLNANEIESLKGIINGTTNYILTAMSEKAENYYDVLKKAQALGYAEADPSSDVDGWDACYKLSVLTGIAFGVQLPVKQINTRGISELTLVDMKMAQDLGYTIKLVASAERKGDVVSGRVHPTLLPDGHPLAHVNGVNNALLVKGDAVGEVLFFGPGAGMMATGSAVTSDLVRICRMITQSGRDQDLEHGQPDKLSPCSVAKNKPELVNSVFSESESSFHLSYADATSKTLVPQFAPDSAASQEGQFFVTIKCVEKPEVGAIAANFYQANLPLKSIFTYDDANLYHVGIITDLCTEQEIQAVIQNLSTNMNYRKILYYYVEGGKKQ